MNVDYISHMGDDLLVVNAARVSFAKEKAEFGTDDRRLLAYLAKNGHWTPYSHPQICLRVKAPIFVARQLFKHKVGMTENEVSRRYVDDTPEFYSPVSWRGRPTAGAKQGSAGLVDDPVVDEYYNIALERCEEAYNIMIDAGVAPEQARMVLPQSMYTEFYWTGSLASYGRLCNLRLDAHAQAETREIASRIDEIISSLFPEAWQALVPRV